MALSLYVDGNRWRAHLRSTVDANPGLVPVAKGNGYGFTLGRLARRAQWLGSDMIAVGTYDEVAAVTSRFPGDVLVLAPWRPFVPETAYDRRILHTIGRLADLAALRSRVERPRVVLEGLTSMRRHGLPPADFSAAHASLNGVRLEGIALHLPLADPHAHRAELDAWLTRLRESRLPTRRVFVSHLLGSELAELRRRHADVELRPRVGTALWLGAPDALSARADVLDAHPVRRGERIGYRQRPLLRDGTVLVVSGGTAHGIGLEAPTSAVRPRQRAIALARGGLDAAGLTLSPFRVAGKQRWLVEPPQMLLSLVFLPRGTAVPSVGDQVTLEARHTATTFDAVVVS